MISRTAILADDERRRAPLRRMRAEAERDLSRRRRLMDRLRSDRAAADALGARFAEQQAATARGIEVARKLINSAVYARGLA